MEVDEGASTSEIMKQDKAKNMPWIEKYRPKKFEEIVGKCGEKKRDFRKSYLRSTALTNGYMLN